MVPSRSTKLGLMSCTAGASICTLLPDAVQWMTYNAPVVPALADELWYIFSPNGRCMRLIAWYGRE